MLKTTLSFTKKLALSVVFIPLSLSAHAEDKIAIDMSELSTTKNEVAVLQVLSEICPPMLNSKQKQGFSNAYNQELKRLLPTISDPKMAIQYLSTQQDYKDILNETREWTLSYSKTENKDLCTELANSY